MKHLPLFAALLLIILQSNIYAQRTIEYVKYYKADGDTIPEEDEGHIIEERYHILKKNRKKKIKHGEYRRYSKLGILLEIGDYDYNKKTGVWERLIEDGFVILEYDYDQNKALEPTVLKRKIFRYPTKYLIEAEENDEFPKQGEVVLKIDFDKDCNLIESELIKTSFEEFNKVTLEGFRKYAALSKKYGQEIKECNSNDKIFKISFRTH